MKQARIVALLCALLLGACGQQASQTSAPTSAPAATGEASAPAATNKASTPAPTSAPTGSGETLVVITHDSFNISEDVLNTFQQASGITVEVRQSGDAGEALNRAILSKDNPQGDIFFGVDNTFLSRALGAGIFEPYNAAALTTVPAQFKLDPSNSLLPIDYGYIAINYDKAYLTQNSLAVPTTLEDLVKPEWKGKLVVENPSTSSPGLAFLLATVGHFGTEGAYTWLDYWKALRANDVLVANGWDEAYNTQFSGSSGKGPRPLVVSYATSPAAEVYYSEGKLAEPPTGNVLAGSFLQVEFAGILKGAQHRAAAERFLDFMLSKPFQEDIPLQMFVYPVQPDAAQPDVFTKFAQVPEQPVAVTPAEIDANREQWISAWTSAVLR